MSDKLGLQSLFEPRIPVRSRRGVCQLLYRVLLTPVAGGALNSSRRGRGGRAINPAPPPAHVHQQFLYAVYKYVYAVYKYVYAVYKYV